MNFNEYLYTDIQDIEEIFNYYLNFLNSLSHSKFSEEKQLQLKAASDKFLNSIEKFTYFETSKREDYEDIIRKIEEEFNKLKAIERKPFIFRLIPFTKKRKHQIYTTQDTFRNLYSSTLSLINNVIQREYVFDNLEIGNFYQPSKSNKEEIVLLLEDAIQIIEDDTSITDFTKKNLTNHLDKAIRDLKSQRTNWTRFFGKLKETTVVLSALGSLAGSSNMLYDAITKIEKASITIRKTSINLSYNVLNEVFNVQNLQNLGLLKNSILKIEDKIPENPTNIDEISE